MYFLIRNGFCVGFNIDIKALEKQKKKGDTIIKQAQEKTADEIFTIDEEDNLIKR